MNGTPRLIRIATWIGAVIGLITALLIPLGYYAIAYKYTIGSLQAEVEINGHIFSGLISTNPHSWQYEQMRLEELLDRRPETGEKEARRVINMQEEVVAQSVDALAPPLISRRYSLKDSGLTVGSLEISRSMRPIAIRAGWIACLGLIIGLTLFVLIKTLPFRTVLKAEKALQESEERFRMLLKHANDAVYVHEMTPDGPGEFIEVNDRACEMLGYDREELIGMGLTEIDVAMHKERLTAILGELDTVGRCLFETEHLAKDGRKIPVEISARLFELREKPVILSLVRDISERKRLESEHIKLQDQLQHSQRMESVGRLAGGVAHDYNNMLSVIIGYTELSMDDVNPDEPLYENLKEVLGAAQRSKAVTRQLLAFARRQPIVPIVLDLNETVESMLKMLRRLIGENVNLTWEPGSNLWPVKIDPAQIDQILANLCVNARDAISGMGKITIETRKETLNKSDCAQYADCTPGQFDLLVFSDDGRGMDENTRENIFEPFYTTKGLNEGTGLGLATVYGIVKQNDGFIDVHSEPGKGTTFRIFLPRHAGKDEDASPASSMSQTPADRPGTILIVEDEAPILKLGRRVLEKRGYHVLTADTPGKALQLAGEYNGTIDLLLVDVVMPEMNGRDLAQKITARFPDIKTLFMSGYTADVIARQGVLDEGIHFIQKPLTPKALALKIRTILDASET